MFVQVIQGKTTDKDGIQRQFQRWNDELRPGATGYVGSTFGVTADGTCIGIACFDSAEAATRNSSRPEQSAWWNETEKYYDGEITFHDSEDIDVQLGGANPSAGFVQIMQGTISDRAKARELDELMLSAAQEMRPDMLGGIGAYYGNGEFTGVSYFTSEAAARAGESQPMPDELAGAMNEWQSIMKVDAWYDLTDPWIEVQKPT